MSKMKVDTLRAVLAALIIYVAAFLAVSGNDIFPATVLIIIYFIYAQVCIQRVVDLLWAYVLPAGKLRVPQKLTATLGVVEQSVYAISFIFCAWSMIALVFGAKLAQRLIKYTNDKPTDDPEENDERVREEGQKRNAYFLGNFISLAVGIGLGFLLKIFLLKLQIIDNGLLQNDKFTDIFWQHMVY